MSQNSSPFSELCLASREVCRLREAPYGRMLFRWARNSELGLVMYAGHWQGIEVSGICRKVHGQLDWILKTRDSTCSKQTMTGTCFLFHNANCAARRAL
ncbi:hypothetical protein VTL71DRAFT_1668, partial [Oculimacula yallundae]